MRSKVLNATPNEITESLQKYHDIEPVSTIWGTKSNATKFDPSKWDIKILAE